MQQSGLNFSFSSLSFMLIKMRYGCNEMGGALKLRRMASRGKYVYFAYFKISRQLALGKNNKRPIPIGFR